MLYELEKPQFKNILHLLLESRCNVEIKAVSELNNPGWIFVDNPEHPRTALVWSKGIEGFYFVGDEENLEFNEFINDYIDEIIVPRSKELRLSGFECSGTSLKWDKTIERVFKERMFHKSYQCVYRFEDFETKYLGDKQLKSNYKVKRIDSELINSNLDNKDFLLSELQLFWGSVDDFLQKGIGFCIMDKQLIVSRCISSFVANDIHAIGIETLKEYKKKGLAKKAVLEILNCLRDSGYEPYWDCMKTNIASASLAESVGFEKEYEYSLYEFSFEN